MHIGVPRDIFAQMVRLRRDLHRHPELSWEEKQTADRVALELESLGVVCRRGVGGHGICAEIAGETAAPAVALRADLDALAVQEESGLPFASENPGVMHACGHDAHSSMLVGAAALLLRAKPLARPVRLIWQPAEETGEGAQAILDAGGLDGVGAIFGGHVDPRYPAGHVVVTKGAVNASTDGFVITIRGKQGHGARPHEAVDAVVIGSLLVTAIQTIVSREINPAHPSVVSVGRFHAGTARNVIAGEATLEGTIRAQSPDVREHLCNAVQRVSSAVGNLHKAEVICTFKSGTPPLINAAGPTTTARKAAVAVVGEPCVCKLNTANMGGEDFAFFLDAIPGCYVRFGARREGHPSYPAHASRFDIDEDVLAVGAGWFAEVARLASEKLEGGGWT